MSSTMQECMAVQIIVKAKLLITLGVKVNLSKRDWFIDSGVTNHTCSSAEHMLHISVNTSKRKLVYNGVGEWALSTFASMLPKFTYLRRRSDNGFEYSNKEIKQLLSQIGKHQLTAYYTSQKNGVAEGFNGTIMEKVRTMLWHS